MVRVVPGVPDSDILEQTSVRPQNVVCPGPHHLSLPPHVPRPSVPIPSSPSRHEMLRHVLQPRCCKIRRDILRPPISLRLHDVHVEVPHHHQLRARWLPPYRRYHRLYCYFILGGDVFPAWLYCGINLDIKGYLQVLGLIVLSVGGFPLYCHQV